MHRIEDVKVQVKAFIKEEYPEIISEAEEFCVIDEIAHVLFELLSGYTVVGGVDGG